MVQGILFKKICLLEKIKEQGLTENSNGQKVTEIGGCNISTATVAGDSPWYLHERQEKAIFVLRGGLAVQAEGSRVELQEHEGVVIPRNMMYKISAGQEATILVLEPKPLWINEKDTGKENCE